MEESHHDRRLQRMTTASSRFSSLGQRITNSIGRRATVAESDDDLRGRPGLVALTDPKDVFVEFIFVQGPRGGSRSTWTLNDDPTTFWPLWLPDWQQFEHVRIHTYGYSVDWQSRLTSTNFHDLGLNFLESIANNGQLKRNSNVREVSNIVDAGDLRFQNPIVLITHSLGGLVVKQAYNLARQDAKYYDLSQRFHTFVFLATPHRGSVSAALRLIASNNGRSNGNDFESASLVAEQIHESFRHNYHDVRLISFYENSSTSQGNLEFIADPRSSTLGFPEETTIPLSTDHLGICKFAMVSDPSFNLIRETLAGVVESILRGLLDPERVKDDMRLLADYLGVTDAEEEELNSLETLEVGGTCSWLLRKPSFIAWRDAQPELEVNDIDLNSRMRHLSMSSRIPLQQSSRPRYFWLTGAPGSGKSVLAGHIIRHLQNRRCYFYFLKHADKSRQNASGLLKSIAFQIARDDFTIRQSFLDMRQEREFSAETHDVITIWKQLFVQRIFRANPQQVQYWVIDGFDDAHGGYELLPLFGKIPNHLPISIFLTSRRDTFLEKRIARLSVQMHHIGVRDTLADIRLYLEESKYDLPVSSPRKVEELITKLVKKSRGSFLWTRLILERLQEAWTDVAIDEVLDSIPEGLQEMYQNILDRMSLAEESNRKLAKSVLRWVTCSARPLTTSELQDAIRLDIGQKVDKLEQMLESVCGQLVLIDDQGRIQLVHDTARDFILAHDLESEFAIDKAKTHERLATICLQYLTEDNRTAAVRRPMRASQELGTDVFRDYASLYFSEHLVKCPQDVSQNLMQRLEVFLDAKVLSWIENIAKVKKDLSPLTQVAKNFKRFSEQRGDWVSLMSRETKVVQDWAIDLIRLVTVFGHDILSEPSIIHRIIPPLCPSASILHRKFSRQALGMEVVGLSTKPWNDRIHSSSFAPDEATALACCERRYAAGLRGGAVVLYYASTCQEATRLEHGEPVKYMEFAKGNSWLIVCGKRKMDMWNYETGQKIWCVDLSAEPLSLSLTEDDLAVLTATKKNQLVWFDTIDGTVVEEISWHGEERPPQRVFMSTDMNLLALVYRNKPVVLFELGDLDQPRLVPVQATASALAFNTAENMLALAHFDGELCTIGMWDIHEIISRTPVDASHLAVSTDGKTLIVGTNLGSIQIRDFETLNVMHVLTFDEDDEIVSMVFTGNGLRFLSIRRYEFDVWEHSALVRRKDHDDSTSEGQSSFSTASSQPVQAYIIGEENAITAMVQHDSGDFIFCGKEDGSVTVFETRRGRQVKELFRHLRTSVTCLDWNAEKGILISADSSSRVLVHKLREVQTRGSSGTRPEWNSQEILEKRLNQSIKQVLISGSGDCFIVSTLGQDHIWTIQGDPVTLHSQSNQSRAPAEKWMIHPRQKRRMYGVDRNVVQMLSWTRSGATDLVSSNISIVDGHRIDHGLRDIGIHFLEFGEGIWAAYDDDASARAAVWSGPASTVNTSTIVTAALDYFAKTIPRLKSIFGLYRSQIVFMSLDGWVCSLRLEEVERRVARHFPVPHYWQNTSRRMIATVTVQGDIIIPKGDELAIVKRGLSASV